MGRTADITPEAQAQLSANVYLHIVGPETAPRLSLDSEGRQIFHHFHTGCWGDISFQGLTTEQSVERCVAALDIVNLDSLMESRVRGINAVNIPHGEYQRTSTWNRNLIAENERTRTLLRSVLERQERVGLDVPNSVLIVGAGGVGWWVTTQLALIGVPEIYIVDNDRVEQSNLSRLPLPLHAVTARKSTRLHASLSALWRGAIPNVVTREYAQSIQDLARRSQEDPIPTVEVIVDTTDRIDAQQCVYALAQSQRARYVRAGYDGGWHVTVSSRCAPSWEVPGTTAGYAVPSWIGGAQIAASLAVTKICRLPRLEVSFDILEVLGGLHDQSLEVDVADYRGAGESLEERLGHIAARPEGEPERWTVPEDGEGEEDEEYDEEGEEDDEDQAVEDDARWQAEAN